MSWHQERSCKTDWVIIILEVEPLKLVSNKAVCEFKHTLRTENSYQHWQIDWNSKFLATKAGPQPSIACTQGFTCKVVSNKAYSVTSTAGKKKKTVFQTRISVVYIVCRHRKKKKSAAMHKRTGMYQPAHLHTKENMCLYSGHTLMSRAWQIFIAMMMMWAFVRLQIGMTRHDRSTYMYTN